MNVTEEETPLPPEGKLRVVTAWLSWFLLLVGSGLVVVYLLILLAFLAIGGLEFVANVLAGQAKNSPMSTRMILGSLFLGFPTGAILGVRLWSKLMRKTGLISTERAKRMSGF